jgi:restriction endonuclease S subunit
MKYERLGNIAEIKTGKYDVNHSTIDGQFIFYTCAMGQFKSPTFSFEGEAIILPGNGANVGEVFFNEGEKFEAYQRTYVVQNIKAFPKYVFHFFKSFWKRSLINAQFGSATNYIRLNNLTDFKIPLPSHENQILIANLLSQADELIKQRKLSINYLDKYLTSVFYEMFGDPIRNEKNWVLELFEKLVAKDCPLTYGIVQPGGEFPNGVPVVRPVDLTETYVKRKGLKLIDPNISEKFRRTILKGFEILMCVRGTTGVVSIASKELKGCNVTRGIVPIWFSKSYNSLFAFFLLKSIGVQKEIQKYTYGATLQQINLGDLRKIKLIQPPLETQSKYASIAQSVTDLKEFYKKSLQELENLYGSFSQQAFKGDLKLNSQKEIGYSFQGDEIPDGKLTSIVDLGKTKWIDATEQVKDVVSKEDSKSTKKDTYKALFPLIGQDTDKGNDLRDVELLIQKYFKDEYFTFEDLKNVIINMGFNYDYEALKNLVFELLRKGKLLQVFADAAFKTHFTDQHPDYHKVKELKEQIYLQRASVL